MFKEAQYSDKTFISYISESQPLSWVKRTLLYIYCASLLILADSKGLNYFYFYCLFMYTFIVVCSIIFTFFVKPSSKNYELLTDGELKDQLESLAERVNFPLDKIFITSHNLTKPKAKCTSIGFITKTLYNRRIVLYKDAIKRNSVEEICALVSSELARSKLSFNLKEFALEQVNLFCIVYTLIALSHNQNLINEFGLNNIPIVGYIALYSHISIPIRHTLVCLLNLVKRRHVFKADSVSKSLGYKESLELGLIKLSEESLNYYNSYQWINAWRSGEPTTVERLNALNILTEEELTNFLLNCS